jgi:hypothetical protein
MTNTELQWVVKKLVKLEAENQALKKRLGDSNTYPIETVVAATWRDTDARGEGIPGTIDLILSGIT